MSNENLIEIKETLCNRIYKTRKIRMNLEERLISTHDFYQMLVVYYSIVLAGFSILLLIKSVTWINYVIIIASISITVLSVYLSSQNYVQRANDIKNNYTKITELEIKLELLENEELTASNLNNINVEYQELLRQVENHNSIDYERTLDKKTWTYQMISIRMHIFRGALILFPVFALIYCMKDVFFCNNV